MRPAPFPAPCGRATANSSMRAAAPSCSTRSARCRSTCRRSCCASSRSGSSPGSARTRRCRSTCASSPPARPISKRRSQPGRFRADLLYRLNVVTLRVPSLAQRREDVPLLFLQLVREAAARYRRDDVEVPPRIVAEIARRDWPGNVRELRNAADRFVLGLGLTLAEEPTAEDATAALADRVADFERERHRRRACRAWRQPEAGLRIARHLPQDALRKDAEIRARQARCDELDRARRIASCADGWICTHAERPNVTDFHPSAPHERAKSPKCALAPLHCRPSLS